MSRHLEFHPDLSDCVLEDRALMAVVVPTLPWLMITGNNSFVSVGGGGGGGGSGLSNLSPLPGPAVFTGGAGSFVGTGASVNLPTIAGVLFSYYGPGYGTRPVGPSGSVSAGSGANQGGGGTPSPGGNTPGYGASFNSGYSTSLNAQNSFGMGPSTAAIGQTTSAGGQVATPTQAPAQAATEATPPPAAQAAGVANPGAPMLGVDVRPEDNLLKGVHPTGPLGVGSR